MQRFTSVALTLLIVFYFVLASQGRAWGYVDPGSGLLALQGFATAMAGVLYYMRRRLMALFGRKQQPVAKPVPLARERPGKAA